MKKGTVTIDLDDYMALYEDREKMIKECEELKFKIQTKNKKFSILYNILATILCILNFAIMWYAATELDKNTISYLKVIIGTIMAWTWILTTISIFKYYR